MRIHSDVLTRGAIIDELRGQIQSHHIAPQVYYKRITEHASRVPGKRHAFEVQLSASIKYEGDGRRQGNSGSYGAGDEYAATYDEWGWLLSGLFAIDPTMYVGTPKMPLYIDRTDFHERTGYTYDTALAERIRQGGDPYPYRDRNTRERVGRRGFGRVRYSAWWTREAPRTAEWAEAFAAGQIH